MYKRILVPTDGSDLSDKAVEEAARLAKLLGAEILLLHVRPSNEGPLYSEGSSRTYAYVSAHKERTDIEKEEHHILDGAAKLSNAMGVTTKTAYVTDSSPYEAIVKIATKEKCDLVVMSSHGRRGLAGLLIGSETLKVLTHISIPVLVVR